MLVIKINCVKLGITKKLQFHETTRIDQVIQQIQEKVPGTKPKGNENYGLFLPNKKKRKSQWLLNSRALEFYDIENETVIIYQDKNRHLKVKLLDGTIKTVMVDDSKSVGHALDIICEKINLTNSEEFSLCIEDEKGPDIQEDEIDSPQKKGLSKRILDKVEEQQNRKVNTLKRKAHTDDDTQWLRNEHTLQEAGVTDDSLVVIRRRYAYEENRNITNPVEIQLLYVQSRDSILDGSHPVSIEEAAKLAAHQNQIMYGDFDDGKYKTNYIDQKDCFPKEYAKNKEAWKKCKEEHSKISGLDHLNAKHKYIQLCQELATYGVTLFIVKEKMKGKNKLIPRLLGINKQSIMKLDEKTKKVLKMWPLTSLRRWAASPNSLTLDFGAYSEGMYSVQTLEGQKISGLIGGYIDIILKKRKKISQLATDDNECGVIAEEHISPHKKQIITTKNFEGHTESITPKYGKIAEVSTFLSPARKALIEDLDNSGKAVIVLMDELDEENDYWDLEVSPAPPNNESGEFDVDVALSSIANANASVIMSSENWEEEGNIVATRTAVKTILSNLTDLSQHARFVASSLSLDKKEDEEDGGNLLEAARQLTEAFKDLMSSLAPENEKCNDDVYNAINKMREVSDTMHGNTDKNERKTYSEVLIMMSKGVEKATESLSEETKQLTETIDEASANKISEACKKAETKAQHLSMCTKILIPFIHDGKSKLQIANTMQLVGKDVKTLSGLCVVATDDDHFRDRIKAAAKGVTHAMDSLLTQINTAPKIKKEPVMEENVYETILSANESLLHSFEEPAEMIKQTKRLEQATRQIINGMKSQAQDMDDGDEKNQLLSAAKLLLDALDQLITASEALKENPNSKMLQSKVRHAVVNLRLTTNMATNNALRKALILKLEHAAKKAVASATQLVATGDNVTSNANENSMTHQKFNEVRQILVRHNAKDLIYAVRESEGKPGNQMAQTNLIRASQDFIPVASRMVNTAKQMEASVLETPLDIQLSKARIDTDKSIDNLESAIEKLNVGHEDCDEALTELKKCLNKLDQASLAAISDTLKPTTTEKLKVLEKNIHASCKAMQEELPDITENGKGMQEKIKLSANKVAAITHKCVDNAISFASNLSTTTEKQIEVLDLTKTVVESMSDLVAAIRDAGGNPHATDRHQAVDEASDNVLEATKDLMKYINETMGDIDSITYLVSSVETAKEEMVHNCEVKVMPEKVKSFVEYQDVMVKALKSITLNAHDMASKSKPKELTAISEDVYHHYTTLSKQVNHAVLFTDPQLGKELKENVEILGDSCSRLIQSAGQYQVSSDGVYAKQNLLEKSKDVSAEVAKVLSNLQKGSVGTQECINAVSEISGLLGDLDTTVMFAHAGTLDPEDDRPFNLHKVEILNDSQSLVNDTKALVGSVQKTQEVLAGNVVLVVKSSKRLINSVKLGALSLGTDDNNGQILLLNAVKDVTQALSDLIDCTKNASGKPADHPDTDSLNGAAKNMVSSLSNLLSTVKGVEDENMRAVRAIESTLDAIKQSNVNLRPENSHRNVTPEDLVRATKGVTLATFKTVSAGNSLKQEDIIEAANVARKQCAELCEIGQAASCLAFQDEVKTAVIANIKITTNAYADVLRQVAIIRKAPVQKEKQKLAELSKNVASAVAKLVKVAADLEGDDMVDPEDPQVIAENELLIAANAIEAAAKKLSNLKPRKSPKDADDTLNFEEQILEAAKAITSAASTLVKAASAAQKELVENGLVCSPETDHYADTHWSQGLVSAARLVVEATSSLCEAANAAILGNASQEKLIASAQAVSASTAQLLLACRVKADPFSKTQKRLQAAGSAVKRASDNLVKAAQENIEDKDEVDGKIKNRRQGKRLGNLVEQIEAKEQVLKKERELEAARKKLEAIQMSRYQVIEDGSTVWETGTTF